MIKNTQKVFTHFEKQFSAIVRHYTSPKYVDNIMLNPHFHEHYELVYVSSGSVIYKIDNKIYKLKKGDFALIPPYVVHITEKKAELEMYIINFTRSYIERQLNQVATENILSSLSSPVYHSNKNIPYILDNNRFIIRQMCAEYEQDENSDDNLMCPYLLFVLLQSIAKYSKSDSGSKTDVKNITKKTLINSILEYTDLHYAQITSLDDIAKEFFISKAHLCKLFKKEIGCTAIQYLTNLKIKNAIELFKSTNYSAKKIAESVGFESNAYFSKVFKDKTGYAPSVYKEMISAANTES